MIDGFETPVVRALHRPSLYGGAERIPVAVLVGATGMLGWLSFSYGKFAAAGVFAALAIAGLYGLRRMAKSDPQMCHVYVRSRKYSRRIFAPTPSVYKDDTRFGKRFGLREKALLVAILITLLLGFILYLWTLF